MQTVRNLPNGLVGIYLLKNKETNTVYIGASADIRKRVLAHLSALLNNRHINSSMQEEFNKYGENAFSFKLVLRCKKDVLNTYEQIILDRYRKYYKVFNKGLSVLTPMSGAKRPDVKIEQLHKHREKALVAFRNYVKTHPKYLENLRETGRKGLKKIRNIPELEVKRKERARLALQTEEARERKRKVMLKKVANGWRPGKPNPINKKQVIYIPTGEIFDSISSACKHCGCSASAMSNHLNGRKHSNLCKGYFFYHPNKATYDVLNVGDKNRFFVRSPTNPDNVLCVHNCGYGMSSNTFKDRMLLTGNTEAAELSEFLVVAYRNANPKIVKFWKTCGDVLAMLYAGKNFKFGAYNMFYGSGQRRDNPIAFIQLPNKTKLFYPNLRRDPDNPNSFIYSFNSKGKWEDKRVWGANLTENLCQAIAFATLKYQALQICKKGIPLSLNVHDEWVSVIPDELVERVALIFREAMIKSPPYFQKGLFDCEVSIGDNYADLKTFDFNNED